MKCFYQPVTKDTKHIILQYEVTKASFDLDIDCIVKDQKGVAIMSVRRRKGRKFEVDTGKNKK